MMRPTSGALTLSSALLLTSIGTTQAADTFPDTLPDGLVRVEVSGVVAVYARPGATLEGYSEVILEKCHVAFRKDWERDYNRSTSFSARVDATDMERIRSSLSEEFQQIFREELTEGGYGLVDAPGDDVLIIRPALLDLAVTAPDTQSAGRSRSYVTSAGSMTLHMELLDSATGDVIATVIDPESPGRGRLAFDANRVSNKAEADKVLRKWARLLREHLRTAREATRSEESAGS